MTIDINVKNKQDEDILNLTEDVSPSQNQDDIVIGEKIDSLFIKGNKSSNMNTPYRSGSSALYIGNGTILKDGIIEAESIIVAGKILDVESIRTSTFQILKGGEVLNVKNINAKDVEIHGTCSGGSLNVEGVMKVGSTGKVSGNLSYVDLLIEKGGIITGTISLGMDIKKGNKIK